MSQTHKDKVAKFPHGESAFGRSISIIQRFTQRFIDKELKEYKISKVHMEALIILNHADKELNQTEVNRFFGYNKATITKILNHLEKEGYIKRFASTNDKRERIISLTAKGNEIYPRIIEAVIKEDKILNEMLDAKDGEFMRNILHNMAESVKGYEL